MIARFLENYVCDDKLFYQNEEIEIYDKYLTYIEFEPVFIYRLKIDGVMYSIPEEQIVVIDKHTNTQTDGKAYKQTWEEEHQEDAAATDGDYTKAAKDYLGINIAPHEGADKADYANQHLLPEWLKRKR